MYLFAERQYTEGARRCLEEMVTDVSEYVMHEYIHGVLCRRPIWESRRVTIYYYTRMGICHEMAWLFLHIVCENII
jgi:hypothetical protein